MKWTLRAAFAAAISACGVGSAAAIPVSIGPTASDFVVEETTGFPGHYTVTNNTDSSYIIGLNVTHGTDASNPSTPIPGWVASDNLTSFNYFDQDAFALGSLGAAIGPHQTNDLFFFDEFFRLSTYTLTIQIGVGGPFASISGPTAATPIPATLPLFASGLAGLGFLARRRKKLAAA
jgi:hypothetical protein